MPQNLGELLDDPGEYLAWIQHSAVAFAAIHAVDDLGLLEGLENGPATIAEIARRRACPEDVAARLLGFLAAEGALEIDPDGLVHATQRTAALAAARRHHNGRMTLEAAFALPRALALGKTGFEARYGMPVFEYLKANPEIARQFGAVMAETTAEAERFIFEQHSFAPFACAVDVGGNRGSLLVRLLEAHPDARGILFDRPETVAEAGAALAGSAIGERIDCVGGDFFASVPAGGDLYLLKQILHDWSDSECLAILRNIRAAMAPATRLAVIERLIPERFEPHNAYVVDIIMLLWTSGRERKLSEFRALLAQAGFAVERVAENAAGMSVIEAVAG